MEACYLIIALLSVLFISMILIPMLPANRKSTGGLLLAIAISLLSAVPAVQALFQHRIIQSSLWLPEPFGEIPIRIDPLSAWFMLIVDLTCFNSALYGAGYMKTYQAEKKNTSLHWISFVTLHVSMLGVCMVQHGLAFLVVWETMSISSLLLVLFEHAKPETLKAGMNYLIQMHIGVILLTVAFIWVYLSEGSFDFSAIGRFFSHQPPAGLFALFFLGFGIKAGFIPLHTWLPHAHPVAPSHISGVMSGVVVKMGIYGLLRVIASLHSGLLQTGEAMLILSLVTALYGILNAAVHRDFKRMLAFCTIENIGIIGMGIGIGLIGEAIGNSLMFLLGFSTALLHTLNHSLYKSLLFFTAGNLYQQTHTRDMERLGGLLKKMPLTGFFFLCGSLAIGTLPPFNGFVSEFLIYTGLVEGIRSSNVQFNLLMIISIATLAIVGGLSMLTFTKSFGIIFLGTPRAPLAHTPKEVSPLMRAPLFLILAGMLLIGVFPNAVMTVLIPMVRVFDGAFQPDAGINNLYPVLATTGRASLGLLVLIALIYYIRSRISTRRPRVFLPTWGCAYPAPNARMQYTGKSFAKSLAKLFSFLTVEKKKYHEIDSMAFFPSTRSYQSHYTELFETRIFDRINKRLIGFMNYFTFIHNGQTQMYVLYGLFFIITLITVTVLNLL